MQSATNLMKTAACALVLAAPAFMAGGAAAQASKPAITGGDMAPTGMRIPIVRAQSDVSRTTVADGFVFAATGDLLGPQNPLTELGDPDFAKVTKILQGADVAFANHETSAFDLTTYPGTQAAQNGGGYPRFDLAMERDFKAMGLDIVSLANNHAGDWGEAGIPATIATVTQGGLVYAGAGGSLSQARAAGLFNTAKGRVAMIATASTFNPSTPAADGIGALKPRAGISTLRTTQATVVTPEEMAALRSIAAARGPVTADAKQVRIGQATYKVGDKPGLTYAANAADQSAIIRSINDAKRANDFVVFSIHAHETNGGAEDPTPGDFLPPLFHAAIDAGADVVVRHGPHTTNGIEIYKGKPIFYALGSLFFAVGGVERSLGGMQKMPDSSYESIIATTEYKGGKASVVRVYPITNNTDRLNTFSAPSIVSGTPEGQKILEKVRTDSRVFGTDMKIENGVGVIRIAG
jgi:poly-gamma-glutamate capsule biosynthesis protein CapA/YwtB (metallophosphatase superfamily)